MGLGAVGANTTGFSDFYGTLSPSPTVCAFVTRGGGGRVGGPLGPDPYRTKVVTPVVTLDT